MHGRQSRKPFHCEGRGAPSREHSLPALERVLLMHSGHSAFRHTRLHTLMRPGHELASVYEVVLFNVIIREPWSPMVLADETHSCVIPAGLPPVTGQGCG